MKLGTILFSSVLLTGIAFSANAADVNETLAVKQEGIKYIKKLGGALKSALQEKLKEDKSGMAALTFCTSQAMPITYKVNSELPDYAKVRRTALKIRNNANWPDTPDRKVMKKYIEAIAAKKFNPNDIKIVKVKDTFRVYKPLVTEGVCLKCHGNNIDEALQKKITFHYRSDKAVGFEMGDLRGVIVAEIKK